MTQQNNVHPFELDAEAIKKERAEIEKARRNSYQGSKTTVTSVPPNMDLVDLDLAIPEAILHEIAVEFDLDRGKHVEAAVSDLLEKADYSKLGNIAEHDPQPRPGFANTPIPPELKSIQTTIPTYLTEKIEAVGKMHNRSVDEVASSALRQALTRRYNSAPLSISWG